MDVDTEVFVGTVGDLPDGKNYGFVWRLSGSTFERVGVPGAAAIPSAHLNLSSTDEAAGQLVEHLCTLHPGSRRVDSEMQLPPGSFYHRIARPSDQIRAGRDFSLPNYRFYDAQRAALNGQLFSLVRMLERILAVVEPRPLTVNAFGTEIRNLLILACTEVEAQWKAVLKANGYSVPRFSTADYVKLMPAMRLGEYAVRLQHHPLLPSLSPFAGWGSSGRPTVDLPWYDAYNAVKHDREGAFERATLEHAISAVAACFVMLGAQYGARALRERLEIGEFFEMEQFPEWDFE